ncbi:MAG TPA: M1 family metallopeptidase [Flavisolibacter sp.]|nr:M1 family metallopeptidase [Flavisolibacter sp.]
MQKLFLILALCCFFHDSHAQYWQQKVSYVIDVTLDDKEKTLDAFEKLTYTNNSPDTLSFIWFHLWPNAYKNDKTAFSDQLLTNGNTKFYFSEKEQKGYINRLDFKVDGIPAKTVDHPEDIDIIKLLLPKPLAPGQEITISTPFHVKLPFNFSRGGYDGQTFQVSQWYPKPAVYDQNGWHPMPYLDQGEFYSEFGSFDVRITLPADYVVASTGNLQNREELDWMTARNDTSDTSPARMAHPKIKSSGKRKPKTTINRPLPPSAQQVTTKTLRYLQNKVHDFAWFANKNFIVNHDTCQLSSGRNIQVFTYYTREEKETWNASTTYAKDAIRFYSNEVGEYPYDIVSVVQGPQSFGGGMEYPTITIISPMPSAKELDVTIAHEIGHNWFYGILASNERDHPWMDEGINSFYEKKYTESKYGPSSQEEELIFQTKALRHTDQPIETSSRQFSESNYGLVAYHKTAEWMAYLEERLGKEAFRKTMQQYFKDWQFRHPQPADFHDEIAHTSPQVANELYPLLKEKGILPNHQLKGSTTLSPFLKHSIRNYLLNPTRNALLLSPAIGINSYDKFMIGGIISNYKLPPSTLQFLAIPLYATGSKQFNLLGKLNYSATSTGVIRKTDVFVNSSHFSMDEFSDTAGQKIRMQFRKITPGIKLTFREKDPLSKVNRYIQWKTFYINEESIHLTNDSLITGTDTALITRYTTPAKDRYLNQLKLVYENSRALYPFDVSLLVEQSTDFIRPSLTANYYFNYPKNGGLNVRFFAGKFLYLNGKTIAKQFTNDRYQLNMSGAKGYEDYTYSDYFIGRNRFEGVESQQIMIRDGGFKVRTDLLADKTGKTDDWLTALNFTTTVPDNINPLSVLPVKIPLRLFLDVGTYAAPWKNNSGDGRFLFDAGIQIPLLAETLNIYIPLLYSKTYGDYFKSHKPETSFWKNISFSIDLFNKDLKAINREVEF